MRQKLSNENLTAKVLQRRLVWGVEQPFYLMPITPALTPLPSWKAHKMLTNLWKNPGYTYLK